MPGPWEQYSQSPPSPASSDAEGPWTQYTSPASSEAPTPTAPPIKDTSGPLGTALAFAQGGPLAALTSATSGLAKQARPDNEFFNTLRNPGDLWKEESLPAHLYSAAKKGTFNKPLSELVTNVRDDLKDFSLSHLWDAAKSHPGQFFGELVNSIVADPELMLAPMGLAGKVASAMGKFGTAAKVAGRTIETGIAGGAVATPLSIAQQLDENGVVSMQQLLHDVGTGAAFSAALGTAIHLGGDLGNVSPKEVFLKMKEKMGKGKGADVATTALDDVLGELDIPSDVRDPIINTIRDHVEIEKQNKAAIQEQKVSDTQIKEMTKQFASEAGPESTPKEQTPAQARSDLGKMATELQDKRIQTEKAEADFSKMTERLQLEEAQRIASQEELQQAKQTAIKQSLDNLANPTKRPMSQGVIIGSAEAARLKPPFLRSADDLVSLQRERIAVDGVETPTLLTPSMKEQGFADPKMLKWIALAGMGTLAGGYFSDDKAEGAVIGAALALGGATALWATKKGLSKLDDALEHVPIGPRDTRIRIDNLRETYQHILSEHGLSGMKAEALFKKLVPVTERRHELTHFIESGKESLAPRTREESLYVEKMRKGNEGILRRERAAGAIEEGIEDGSYMAHFFKGSPEDIAKVQRVFSSMNKKNPHAMHRSIPSYEAAEQAGLTPKTLDSAEIFRMRLENSGKAIARRTLFDSLKEGRTPEGGTLIARSGSEGTQGYQKVPHPSLEGYSVHPDIAPSLGLLYSHLTPNAALEGLQTVNSAMNRLSLSMSFFHPMSLAQALAGTTRFLRTGPQSWKFLGKAHDAWMLKGSEALLHDAMVDGRVKIEPHKGVDVEYDKIQNAMQYVSDKSKGWLSAGRAGLALGAGALAGYETDWNPAAMAAGAAAGFVGGRATLRATQAVDKMLQNFLWDYVHPVFKLATFGAEQERALASNVERAARGEPVLSKREISKNVGSAVNDIYGGIQWQDIAEGVQNKYGRNLAIALAQPDSQRLLSIALRAPDWFASTTRSIVKAFPGVTKKEISQIHRAYTLNSLLMFGVMADGMNMYFSGHHVWENKDPTRVDLGDGRTMQTNKHLMEFFHLASHPAQALLSKLSPLASEVGEQALGAEFLAPMRKMIPMQEGRLSHLAKGVLPISAKGESPEQIVSSLLGLPIYGRTKEETAARKQERAQKKAAAISKLIGTGMTRKEARSYLKEKGL